MVKQYRIAWRSKITGTTGYGEWSMSLRLLAELAVEYLNKNYPDVEHWFEERHQ